MNDKTLNDKEECILLEFVQCIPEGVEAHYVVPMEHKRTQARAAAAAAAAR